MRLHIFTRKNESYVTIGKYIASNYMLCRIHAINIFCLTCFIMLATQRNTLCKIWIILDNGLFWIIFFITLN